MFDGLRILLIGARGVLGQPGQTYRWSDAANEQGASRLRRARRADAFRLRDLARTRLGDHALFLPPRRLLRPRQLRALWPRLFPRDALRRAGGLRRRCGSRNGWARRFVGRRAGERSSFSPRQWSIGPGLIVNLGFKDHWGRPRPYPDPGLQRRRAHSSHGTTPTARARGTVRSSPAKRRPASGWSRRRACCRRHGAVPRSSPPSPSGSALAC